MRVREYRESGRYSTQQAVALGLYRTGSVITAAGTVMAIAFSGLLFSDIPALNQVSLYLVAAVLFDTFVVRTLVLTSAVGLLRDAAWWPARVPALKEAHSMSPDAIESLRETALALDSDAIRTDIEDIFGDDEVEAESESSM